MKFIIANKWVLDVPPDARVHEGHMGTFARPYTWFVENKTKDVSLEMWCYEQLLQCVEDVYTVVEYFGGVGCDATMIDNMLHPKRHVLVDIDEWQANRLMLAFPNAEVYTGDFFDVAGFCEADLACMDFNSFTMHQLATNPKMYTALGNVLSCCQLAIITDTAINKIWLNASGYGRVSGMQVDDMPSYLDAMSHYLYAKFGHSIVVAASHRNAVYYLVHKHTPTSIDYTTAPDSAKTSHFRKMIS